MANDVAIKVDNVSKTFKLPYEKNTSIKSAIVNFYKLDKGSEKQEALKDISFEVKAGEFFGIVGRNGSGKSTLLKLLAGIYSPNKGDIKINGKLTPFIELGVGFNPELTGRENVFLNGALLGFSRKEMETMYEGIVDFAEIRRFMDQKLKNYSSGMQVRLAFSIAIRAQTDILLIDEVLAVGDAAFQQKCFDYFDQIKNSDTTVVFVSHDMDAVKRFCDKAVLINNGKLQFIGKPEEAADLYIAENEEQIISNLVEDNSRSTLKQKSKQSADFSIEILNKGGLKTSSFNYGEKMLIKLRWSINLNPRPLNVGIALSHEGRIVFGSNTGQKGLKSGTNTITEEVILNLGSGKYTMIAALFDTDSLSEAYVYEPHGPEFYIRKSPGVQNWEGLTKLENKWDYEK